MEMDAERQGQNLSIQFEEFSMNYLSKTLPNYITIIKLSSRNKYLDTRLFLFQPFKRNCWDTKEMCFNWTFITAV